MQRRISCPGSMKTHRWYLVEAVTWKGQKEETLRRSTGRQPHHGSSHLHSDADDGVGSWDTVLCGWPCTVLQSESLWWINRTPQKGFGMSGTHSVSSPTVAASVQGDVVLGPFLSTACRLRWWWFHKKLRKVSVFLSWNSWLSPGGIRLRCAVNCDGSTFLPGLFSSQ